MRPPDQGIRAQVTSLGYTSWNVGGLRNRVTAGAAQAFAQAANGRDMLLYVHGYNETFESAASSAATLSDAIGFQGKTALFAWPSGGRLLNYIGDRESATWSQPFHWPRPHCCAFDGHAPDAGILAPDRAE
jgi:hypothetical protein